MNYHHSTKITHRKIFFVRLTASLLMFIFGMLLGISANGQEIKQQSNFYAITGNGLKDTSWLFGTYHLVKSSYLNEVPEVVQAFNKAKAVTVELVLDSSKTVAAASMGLLKNKTLSDLLDKPFSDSLQKELKTVLGIGIEQINQLKPINVALTLSMVYLVTDTKSPLQKYSGSMLDGYFAEKGKLAGKKITEFETIEEQMNVLFNSVSNEEQVNQLKYFVRNKSEMINQGNELIENWFKHDLEKMYSVSEKGMAVFGNENDFLNNRNNKWMKMLPGLLKKESQFIAVGALHLAGPSGLVKQLQDLGYTLTPIKL
jgi:uncharacterized protein YbaP (TraB family)